MGTIAVGGRGGEVGLVDLRTHRVRVLRSRLDNYVDALAFTPGGDLMAADSGRVLVFRHLERAHPEVRDLSHFTNGQPGPSGADLSPDGHTLAGSRRAAP